MDEIFEPIYAAGFAAGFFGFVEGAEFEAGLALGLFAREAFADQVFGAGFDVETDFVVEVVVLLGAVA